MSGRAEKTPIRLALVWRGDPAAVPLQHPRLQPIYDALVKIGVTPIPVAFSEATVDDARAQILTCDGALTWVDPLTDGVDRTRFDAMLRDVAARGVWINAHPDVILKMGVKEVLVRTKELAGEPTSMRTIRWKLFAPAFRRDWRRIVCVF